MSFGQDLVHVADDAEVGDPEDRGLGVLVDGDDVLGALHADHVLGGAGDADRRCRRSASRPCRSGRPGSCRAPSRRRRWRARRRARPSAAWRAPRSSRTCPPRRGRGRRRRRWRPRRAWGPVASSTWRFVIFAAPAAPVSGTASASTAAAGPPPVSSAANDFGRTSTMFGAAGGELRAHHLRATEDRRAGDDGVAVDGDLGVVREHRLVERHRQAGGDVATVVGGAEQDQVGGVAALDRGGQRGATDVHAGQPAAEVAGGVHLRRAVRAEGRRPPRRRRRR